MEPDLENMGCRCSSRGLRMPSVESDLQTYTNESVTMFYECSKIWHSTSLQAKKVESKAHNRLINLFYLTIPSLIGLSLLTLYILSLGVLQGTLVQPNLQLLCYLGFIQPSIGQMLHQNNLGWKWWHSMCSGHETNLHEPAQDGCPPRAISGLLLAHFCICNP